MPERFSNNATAKLAASVTDTDTSITLAAGAGASRFAGLDPGDFQRATITLPGDPDVFEIVHITGRSGMTLTVDRGVESTFPLAWPAGADISARVTAEMLGGLRSAAKLGPSAVLAMGTDEVAGVAIAAAGYAAPSAGVGAGGLAINTDTRVLQSAWVIGGYPILQQREYQPPFVGAVEAVGCSPSFDLGTPPVFVAGTEYPQGAVVRPAGAGAARRLTLENDQRVYVAGPSESELLYYPWAGIDYPPSSTDGFLVMLQMVPDDVFFFPTEVGFICDAYNATSAPSISVGSAQYWSVVNATQFANAVPLSTITGARQIHRITGIPSVGVRGLAFKLTTPATGSCRGRFYWKGMFVESVAV